MEHVDATLYKMNKNLRLETAARILLFLEGTYRSDINGGYAKWNTNGAECEYLSGIFFTREEQTIFVHQSGNNAFQTAHL